MDPDTPYRRALGAGDAPVVMYAGNVGYSQSLGLVLAAAAALPSACFVINGDGSARAALEREALHLPNVRFIGYQPVERLPEVLASADVHVVPLRAGLGRVSVPSKTYSILAAGRPLVAAVDPGTEIPRMVEASGAGICVPPDDEARFVEAVSRLLADPEGRARMGGSARRWVEAHASPAGVAERYEAILRGDG
jgi:colanic acid biosynthesis glycosyl transferase WcaI